MPGHVKLVKGAVDPDPTEYLLPSVDMKKEDQNKPYEPKQSVWVPDPKTGGYREGLLLDGAEIASIGAEDADLAAKLTIAVGHEKVVSIHRQDYNFETLKVTHLQKEVGRVNPPKFEKCEDMVNLTFLNDASVFWNLKTRYAAKMIHTYSGSSSVEEQADYLSLLSRSLCDCDQSVQEVPDLHPQGFQDLSRKASQRMSSTLVGGKVSFNQRVSQSLYRLPSARIGT